MAFPLPRAGLLDKRSFVEGTVCGYADRHLASRMTPSILRIAACLRKGRRVKVLKWGIIPSEGLGKLLSGQSAAGSKDSESTARFQQQAPRMKGVGAQKFLKRRSGSEKSEAGWRNESRDQCKHINPSFEVA